MTTTIQTSCKFGRIERRDWCVSGHSSYKAQVNPPPEALD